MKKIEEYENKFNKIVKTIKLLAIAIFTLGILISIVQYTINRSKSLKENQYVANESNDYVIDLEDDTVIYQSNMEIKLEIKKFEEESNYKIIIRVNNEINAQQEHIEKKCHFNIDFKEEGLKSINIMIYKNNEEKYNKWLKIYYIEPYKKQVLDELENKGVAVHFRNANMENYEKSIPLLNSLGNRYIRDDLYFYAIYNIKNGVYNFSNYDKWIEKATENDLKFVGILTTSMSQLTGDDKKINTDEEIEKFAEISATIANRYPQIEYFEILNEPNYATDEKWAYMTKDDIEWYSKLVGKVSKRLKQINKNIKILAAATATAMESGDTYISSMEFMSQMTNFAYLNSFGYSFHPYDIYRKEKQNEWMYYKLNVHNNLFNNLGGFIKKDITEYGVSSYSDINIDEKEQAQKLVQQTIITDCYNADLSIIYNFWNKGTDENNREQNYGLLHNNYTPKLSYYAMKNFYQNTNGAEYIGTLDAQSGLESHVYNKDGNPLVIAWSNNQEKTYDFTLNNMTAKDLYGKNIAPDENGKIQITTSPVYLYNADYNTFYQAISNVSTKKYDEFTQKFAEQISKVPGLQSSIQKAKKSMQDISGNSELSENTAINLMKEHYSIGSTLLQAYKSGTLQIEYVKLSSMLDFLNDIGNSLEDLVTVSAKTRNAEITATNNKLKEASNLINANEDLDIVYPNKILQFSQDFYDTASYINGLTEENDIKTGLIVSKNLHSDLLANWSLEFTNLYINDYIKKNPVEIEYSKTEPTNKDVTATLKTNANITITNNQNSKTYKFTQNGSFTFEYEIKGQKFTKTATVTNIDKQPPTINGVQNEGFYTTSVTPKITDENLKEVKLYKNSNIVQNYKANTPITEEGKYKITAIDKAGNQTTLEFDVCYTPATVAYSETNFTNKDVTTTLVSNYDVKVTNNSGEKIYRFSQNGTFTFNYTFRGKSFTSTANVNNIDKNLPVINGVENGKMYVAQAVKPIVNDENLDEVKLYLNSILVKDYKHGAEITEDGFYKIVATDKAGNQTTVTFSIMKNNNEQYKIKDKYILNVSSNTKKEEFMKKFNNKTQYQMYRDGQTLISNDIIATGDIVKLSNGDEYTIIVTGDLNKDGRVSVTDIVKLRKYILTRSGLDDIEVLAADTNLDEKDISVSDLVKMRLIILSKGAT